MFADLDATLQAMLDDAAAPAELRAADVSFVTPDKDYKPTQPTVNAYLHEVSENRQLRDDARVLERTGNTWSSRVPPVRLDCTYLVTAWSADTAALKVAQEHRLLGLALVWFSRFPVLPERFLAGSLANPAQPYPLPSTVAQTREGQPMGQFWSALGTPPRPAFSVTVTITVDPFDQVEQFAALEHVQLDSALLGAVDPAETVLAGRVLDAAAAVVPGAQVTLDGGATDTTDAAGRFAFPGVAFGDHTLHVEAAGHPAADVPVAFAVDHRFHDVVLTT